MIADRDWPYGSMFVAAFVLLVGALLGAVRGWSAPFGAWAVLASCVLVGLALHALAHALAAAWRRAWPAAALAAALATAFAVATALVPALGRAAAREGAADPFGDVPAQHAASAGAR